MPVTKSNVLDFEAYALERLSQGERIETLDDLLDEYHQARRTSEQVSEDMTAIRASLADLAAGERGRLFEEFDEDFRARNGLSGR